MEIVKSQDHTWAKLLLNYEYMNFYAMIPIGLMTAYSNQKTNK